jgi:hypothetical protein
MQTRAALVALLGLFVAGSAGSPSAWAKKKVVKTAALDASGCLDFSQFTDDQARAINFKLDNTCAQPIKCSLKWQVSCPGGPDGERHDQAIDLDGKGRQSVEASAAVCGDGSWKISPAEWRCHFSSSEPNTASR